MEIIPVINCNDLRCVEERMNIIRSLNAPWAQIDVADGIFAPVKMWNGKASPQEVDKSWAGNLKKIFSSFSEINIEAHLMVMRPFDILDDWISLGVKRIIIHAETATPEEARKAKEKIQLGIALLPETFADTFDIFSNVSNFVQVLAVHQGFSGQTFEEPMIEKIKILRKKYKNIDIEVDGGVTPFVLDEIKRAGANIATAGSFIFDSKNPLQSYKELCKV